MILFIIPQIIGLYFFSLDLEGLGGFEILIGGFMLYFPYISLGAYLCLLTKNSWRELAAYRRASVELVIIGFGAIILGLLIFSFSLIDFIIQLLPTPPPSDQPSEPGGPIVIPIDPVPAEELPTFIPIFDIIPSWILLFTIIVAFRLFVTNRNSQITRLMTLGLINFAIAWIIHTVFRSLSYLFEHVAGIKLNLVLGYVGFSVFFFTGILLIVHACQSLITPNTPYLDIKLYIVIGVCFVLSLLFSVNGIDFTQHERIFILLPDFDILYGLFLGLALIIPILYSVFLLNRIPDWLTRERRTWVKRTQLAMILFLFFPLIESISNIKSFPIFYSPTSPFNETPLKIFLYLIGVTIQLLAMFLLLISTYDVEKWFFDEIKIRATPELRELNPKMNLTALWEQVDEWQKSSQLTQREMTMKKLEEYVQSAKQLMQMEEEKLTRSKGNALL